MCTCHPNCHPASTRVVATDSPPCHTCCACALQQQDERQSLKFYDVARLDDEEVMRKSASLSSFTATLLRDPRVVQCIGEADIINDPDGAFVYGPNAAEVLSDTATVPTDCHPRDHWAPSFFLAGPTGCVAAVAAFRRDPDDAEWVPHR